MEYLQKALEFINGLGAAGWIGMVALVLESVLRLKISEKPMSILYMISDGIKLVAKILDGVGGLLDKILPQRVLPPQ